ncbi:TIM barrel protein [Paracidobacterium acidisoli]|uniref:Sugar isomerase n=1 Tax=Paracidobacterium acidisoli TaxID=2303751 RepID=A0A372IKX3_9BACT|nr:TIM barrel protein [Paracidobacterium acidisoli]MBT9332580.1 TIM barrel protein [Paracidobacterium acidisoli]
MSRFEERIHHALDSFQIELPSWGFANTGTRFGKFQQAEAATSIEEKFADAAEVHALTGASPSLALHVEWDLPNGVKDAQQIRSLAAKYGIRAGAINPNLFERQEYKYGSICNPDKAVRAIATDHLLESVEIAKALGMRDVSLWVSDGSNYPGSQSIRRRIDWMLEVFAAVHAALGERQRMLIEYKPFEPAFYHTDIADWGMALVLARRTGPKATVLVDTGHHYQGQNIEQIVTWLLHEELLGGFHFNDRKYADDDLTLGSIDPYQIFRIFHEIFSNAADVQQIPFMIDQSHNLKGKMEAMVQTVCNAQEIFAKAAIVDRERLGGLQDEARLVEAEECLREAFWFDVRPAIREWRRSHGIAEDPLDALRTSGYLEKIRAERRERNAKAVVSYA